MEMLQRQIKENHPTKQIERWFILQKLWTVCRCGSCFCREGICPTIGTNILDKDVQNLLKPIKFTYSMMMYKYIWIKMLRKENWILLSGGVNQNAFPEAGKVRDLQEVKRNTFYHSCKFLNTKTTAKDVLFENARTIDIKRTLRKNKYFWTGVDIIWKDLKCVDLVPWRLINWNY